MSVNYMAPQHAAEYFHKHASSLGLSLDCEIVDVATGTGCVGQEVNISHFLSTICLPYHAIGLPYHLS